MNHADKRHVLIRDDANDRSVWILTHWEDEQITPENIIYYTWDRPEEEGPALIEDKGGWGYYRDDMLHRENGPARYVISKHGVMRGKRYQWFVNGNIHREDGPASTIHDYDTDEVIADIWFLNNTYHCSDGPAVRNYRTGVYEWYVNGVEHNAIMNQYCIEVGIDVTNLTLEDKIIIKLKLDTLCIQ